MAGDIVQRPTETCFHCGEPDHFQRECQRRVGWGGGGGGRGNVSYPLSSGSKYVAGEHMC